MEVMKDPTSRPDLAGSAKSRPPPGWRMLWPQLCGRTRPGSGGLARSSAASCAVQVSLGGLQTQISCLHAVLCFTHHQHLQQPGVAAAGAMVQLVVEHDRPTLPQLRSRFLDACRRRSQPVPSDFAAHPETNATIFRWDFGR